MIYISIIIYYVFYILKENEVAELNQKYINLYANFQQNKLIAMKCARLTDIILKTQETLDAKIVHLFVDVSSK